MPATKNTATKNTATKNKPKSQRSNGKNSRQQIEEAVADRIIELLDQGKLPPWEKDWQDSPYGFPVNRQHEALPGSQPLDDPVDPEYHGLYRSPLADLRGVNRWMTLLTQNIMGYTDPRWLTAGRGPRGSAEKYPDPG